MVTIVPLTQLWLPILLSAVVVFVASSVIHMVFTYHRSSYKKLPNEDKIMQVMREAGVTPGLYPMPHCANPKEMKSEEMLAKYKAGPVGFISVIPSGPVNMGKYLGQWFLFCVGISIFVAYLTGRTVSVGTHYLAVFRIAGTIAFMGYAASNVASAIWKGQAWSVTLKEVFDGLVYGLLTAGVFGWLWPR